jgi:phage head maturation protease
LVSAYSIGFRPLKTEPLPGGGLRHVLWELLEVSTVAIPANPDCRIQRSATGSVRLIRGARAQAPIRLITHR